MKNQSVKVRIGITIAALLVLLVWFFWPRPVVSAPVSWDGVFYSDGVYYDVIVIYGSGHQNEYHLYDQDTVYSSDKEETAYPMDEEFQEKLDVILSKYTMRRTLFFDRQFRVYNITRHSDGAYFMNLYLGNNEGLVQVGPRRYRVREADKLFSEIQPLIDDYLAEQEEEGLGQAEIAGSSLREAAALLADPDQGGEIIFAIVGNGIIEKIPEDYFMMRVALWELYGEADPVEKALESIKRETMEKAFANQHKLMPTKQEIRDYVQNERKTVESTLESSVISSKLIESMGFTEDYYWNEYKPLYEAPAAVIHSKVSQYIDKNAMEELDISNLECEIIDSEKYERIVNH